MSYGIRLTLVLLLLSGAFASIVLLAVNLFAIGPEVGTYFDFGHVKFVSLGFLGMGFFGFVVNNYTLSSSCFIATMLVAAGVIKARRLVMYAIVFCEILCEAIEWSGPWMRIACGSCLAASLAMMCMGESKPPGNGLC